MKKSTSIVKSVVKAALYSLVFLLLSSRLVAQCADPNITKKSFCLGQQAEIIIDDPNPDVSYHWYYPAGGSLFDGEYGVSGSNGRNFLSPTNLASSGTYEYYVIQEFGEVAGPSYQAPAGGALYDSELSDYAMPFNALEAFSLDSVTVVVELKEPNKNYYFEIAHTFGSDTKFSSGFIGKQSDFENIDGDIYRVTFPVVGIDSIPIGNNQTIALRSSEDSGGGYLAVERFYWWEKDIYSGGAYANSQIVVADPTALVDADERSPLIFDWAVTMLCQMKTVEVTESTDCCVPVEDDFALSTVSPVNTFKASELPVDIDASGSDITGGMHYFWYDKDGNELSSASGVGKNTLNASTFGRYTLRVVNDASDISSAVCYSEKNIKIDSANIVVSVVSDACGGVVNLEASGAIGNYTWSDANIQGYGEMSTKDGPTTVVEFSQNGTYMVEVTADVLGGEVAIDGGFDAFDKDNLRFETTYAYPTVFDWATLPSGYWVDDEVFAYSASYCGSNPNLKKRIDPITGQISDRGNFMLFDAANPAGAANTAAIGRSDPMWKLVNQPVKPGTDYTFSVDVLPWPASSSVNMMLLVAGNTDAQAEPIPVTINGSGSLVAGGTVAKVTGGCNWSIVSGTWNSGTNTSVTFMVSEVGSSGPGHEGAIDNISFNTGVTQETAVVELEVNLPPTPSQIDFCTNQAVNLQIGDGKKWKWCEDDACVTEIGIEDGAPVPLPASLKVEGESFVYLQSAEKSPLGTTGTPGASLNGNSLVSANSYTSFSVYKSVNLVSVKMILPSYLPAANRKVQLYNVDDATVIAEQDVVINGLTTIPLGFTMTPGNYRLILKGGNAGSKPIYSGNPLTYTLANTVDITGYYNPPPALTEGPFGDFLFEKTEACTPVPVKLFGSNCCTQFAATIAVKSGTATTCVGAALVLEATPNAGTTAPVYQWYNDAGIISGETSSTLTVADSPAAVQDYWVVVTSSATCSDSSPASNKLSVTVNSTPSEPVLEGTQSYCVGEGLSLNVSSGSATIGATYSWKLGTGALTGTGSSYTVDPVALTDGGDYTVSASLSGCVSTASSAYSVTVNQAPSITLPSAAGLTVCAPLEADISGSTDVGTLTYHEGSLGTGAVVSDPTSVATGGDYSLKAVNGTCSEVSGIVVFINEEPEAELTGGGSICDDGSTLPLTITLKKGKAPFSVEMSSPVGALSGLSSPHEEPVSSEGTYTLSNLLDDNGCVGTVSGSAEIIYNEEATATVTKLCTDETPRGGVTLAADEFQIVVEMTQGEVSSGVVTGDNGVSFTQDGTSSFWYSGAIDEDLSINVNTTDGNDCGGGEDELAVNRVCSCPASVDAIVLTAEEICKEGSTTLTVDFSGGSGNYNVTLTTPSSPETDLDNATGQSVFSVSAEGSYSVSVESIADGGCLATSSTVTLDYFDEPEAELTGGGSICDDGSTLPLTITLKKGKAPFSVEMSSPVGALSGLSSPHEEPVSSEGTYTLSNLLDDNGCVGTVSGSAEIIYNEEATATVTKLCTDETPRGGVTLAADEFQIVVEMTQGEVSSGVVTGDNGVSFTQDGTSSFWYSGAIDEDLSINVNTTDGNDCGGGEDELAVTRKCSCPIELTASLSLGEVCTGKEDDLLLSVTNSNTLNMTDYTVNISGAETLSETLVPDASGAASKTYPVSTAGTYTVEVLSNGDNGCTAGAVQLPLVLNPLPTGTLELSSGEYCEGSTAPSLEFRFTGTSDFTYGYEITNLSGTTPVQGQVATGTSESVEVSPVDYSEHTYTLISLKDDNDCEALATGLSSSATARKKAIPEAPVFTASSEVSNTNSVCQGTAYTMTAESSTTSARITWTSPSALADQTNPSEISGTTTGSVVEYKAKSVLEGCESTEELQSITLNPSATVSIAVDQAVRCESDQAVNNPVFTATALGHNVASGYSWIWIDEDGLETPLGTTNTPSFSQLSTLDREKVTMYVEVENNIACGSALLRSATPAVVTVVETPVVQIEEYIADGERTKYVCSYDMPYTLNAKVQPGLSVAYLWKDGLGNEVGTTQSYEVPSSGTYNVIATTTSNGVSCASDQGYVTVGDDAEVEVNIQDLKVTAVSTAYDVEQGEVVILTASPEGEYPVVSELAYDWSFNGSGIGSGQQLEHVVMATGVYKVVLTDELTNCEADTMLTINMLEPVTIPAAFTPNGDGENDAWEIPGLETYRQANLKLFNRWGQLVYEMSGVYAQDFDGRRGGTDLPVGTYYYVIKLNVPGREPLKGDLTILR